MAQPPAYNRGEDFTQRDGDDTNHSAINAELDNAATSINRTRENLAKIQRDDGGLVAGIVDANSLSENAFERVMGRVNDAAIAADTAANASLYYSQTAVNAADSATQSASNAQTSANQVAQAATSAQASATAAASSASLATNKATAADSAATAAASSASLATNKATAADSAATAAVSAANTALAHRDASQVARTGAEAAQAAAHASEVAAAVSSAAADADRIAAEAAKYALFNDLASSADGKGAALVGYDGGTAQDVLDSAKPLADYTALRAYTGRATAVRITAFGIAGQFYLDTTDTTTADNGGTVIVDASGRRWKRTFDGAVSVRWFGAKADGVTDDTSYIQAAIDADKVIDGGSLNYLVSSIKVASNRRLQNFYLTSTGGSTDFVSIVDVDGTTSPKASIEFTNVRINGRREAHTNIASPTEDGGRHGFRIRGKVSGLRLHGCIANNCAGDGLELFSAGVAWPAFQDIVVKDCNFRGNRRHGFSLDSCIGVTFSKVTANDNGKDINTTDPLTSGTRGARIGSALYGNGCDAESYGPGTHIEDVLFDNCTMLGNCRSGLLLLPNGTDYGATGWKPFRGITIRGGHYDAGVDVTSEGFSIGLTALGLVSNQIGFVGVTLDNPHCAKGFLLKYVDQADVSVQVDSVDNAGYHALVVDSFNIGLEVVCSGTPVIYRSNCTLATKQKFTGTTAPTLSVLTGPVEITAQTTTLLTSSKESGSVYVIEADVNLTGTDATQLSFLSIAGGRTVVNVNATAVDGNTGDVRPLFFRQLASTIFFKPGTMYSHNMTIFVTVL